MNISDSQLIKRRKHQLIFVPAGGLANRMMAIASAYTLSQRIGNSLQVLWFQDWALRAPFHSIFTNSSLSLNIKDSSFVDRILYDRARRKNLWIPSLPQRLLFDRRLKENRVCELQDKNFNFEDWASGHRCYMSCFCQFENYPDKLYCQLFQPVSEVMNEVDRFRQQFSNHTIGLHIRRTDHKQSIANSPDYLFFEKVEQEVELHDDTKVFLATDNNMVKKAFHQRFGDRILFPKEEARRDSISGIRGGLVDMYTLAATGKIYGSAGSTFSPMAAKIGGREIEILKLSSTK